MQSSRILNEKLLGALLVELEKLHKKKWNEISSNLTLPLKFLLFH